jgi:hypothetical protein
MAHLRLSFFIFLYFRSSLLFFCFSWLPFVSPGSPWLGELRFNKKSRTNEKRPLFGSFLTPVLDGPFHFSRTQAAGTDFNGFAGPVDFNPEFPDVRHPSAFGFDIGMADAVSGFSIFTAYFTTKGQFIHLQQGNLNPALVFSIP